MPDNITCNRRFPKVDIEHSNVQLKSIVESIILKTQTKNSENIMDYLGKQS